MAKRITAAVASVLLCLSLTLLVFEPKASAVMFTAVNNEILELTADTQPEYYDGKLYLPGSVFATSSLGVVTAVSRQQLFLYRDGKSLTFSVADDSVKDQDGSVYGNVKPIYRYGRIYVPVVFVCVFFGFSYSYISSSPVAPIIRIKCGDVLEDSVFAEAATPSMRNRLSRYENSLISPMPSVTPAATPSPSEFPYYGDINVYLGFIGLDTQYTPAILSMLKRTGTRAAFFLTAEEVNRDPNLVRRMIGEGHSVGMLAAEESKEEWRMASEALMHHTVSRSLLAGCLSGGGETAETLGLKLCFNEDTSVLSAENGDGINTVMAKLLNAEDSASVIISTDSETLELLEQIIEFTTLGRFNVRVMCETSHLG